MEVEIVCTSVDVFTVPVGYSTDGRGAREYGGAGARRDIMDDVCSKNGNIGWRDERGGLWSYLEIPLRSRTQE